MASHTIDNHNGRLEFPPGIRGRTDCDLLPVRPPLLSVAQRAMAATGAYGLGTEPAPAGEKWSTGFGISARMAAQWAVGSCAYMETPI